MKSCKHSPVFGASALLALLSITNAGLVAQTATSGQLISPVRTLDLKATLPQGLGGNSLTVQGVRFRNGDLYFAISHSFKADGVTLIRTNSKGQLLSTYSPPENTALLQDFDVGSDGTLYALVLAKQGRGPSLVRYGETGMIAQGQPVPPDTVAVAAGSGSPFLLARTNGGVDVFAFDQNPQRRLSITLHEQNSRIMPAMLPDGRLAIAEATGATVHFVDTARHTSGAFMPRVPEMSWLGTLPPGNGNQQVAFADMTVASTGEVYLLLGSFRLADGAAVVEFHMNGNIAETIRFELPQFSASGERISPSYMSAGAPGLLVLVSGDGKVAEYQL